MTLRIKKAVIMPGAGRGRLGKKRTGYEIYDELGFVAGPFKTKAEAKRELESIKRRTSNPSQTGMIPAYLQKTKSGAFKVLVAAKHMMKLNPPTRRRKRKR